MNIEALRSRAVELIRRRSCCPVAMLAACAAVGFVAGAVIEVVSVPLVILAALAGGVAFALAR